MRRVAFGRRSVALHRSSALPAVAGLEKAVTDRILGFLNAPSELLSVLKNCLLDEENAPPSGFYAAVVERAAEMVKLGSRIRLRTATISSRPLSIASWSRPNP
jgi:hypothetical protein